MVGSAVAAVAAATLTRSTTSPDPDGPAHRWPVPEENESDDARHLRHDQRVPPPRVRHRLTGGADRAPHRADQHAHGAPEGPQEGSSLPPGALDARRSETSPARLPPPQRRREVPGAHRQARSPPVTTFEERLAAPRTRYAAAASVVSCHPPTEFLKFAWSMP